MRKCGICGRTIKACRSRLAAASMRGLRGKPWKTPKYAYIKDGE